MKFEKKQIFTIPNILTYIRILCVPFFIWIILDKSISHNTYIAFGLFIFASVTDLVDGFIARHYHLISDIGKVADPIADKLLQVSTLVCLTVLGKIHWGFPLVFCIKETYMVLGGSAIVKLFKSEYVLQSNIFGKGATCLNSLGIVLSFFVGEVYKSNGELNKAYDIAANVILICGAVFAIVTAVIYTIQFFKFRKLELANKKAIATESLNMGNEGEIIVENSNVDNSDLTEVASSDVSDKDVVLEGDNQKEDNV